MAHELRDYQNAAIDNLRNTLRRGVKRVVLQMPTGAGKTALAGAIVRMATDRGKKVIFTVPALSLVDQTVESFESDGVLEIGVMQAFHERTDGLAPVQVCSVQTLMRRKIPKADLVIVDEAHVLFKFYKKWFNMPEWKDVPIIGLSATPWAKGMGDLYQELIIGTTTQKLIDEGYLSDFRCFAPSKPDLSRVRTLAGDYHEGDLGEVMDDKAIVADIVKTWLQKGENRPTLCFAVNRAHAIHIQDQFLRHGVAAGYMDAFTKIEDRQEIQRRFADGDLKVVCNVGVLTTGVDWDVRCIILARPTKSEMLYTQIIGRGLRTAEGKDHCIARGSKILTDKGEVNIEDVTLDHLVWDGVNFVKHAGAVCRGVQPVIEYFGITATSDHMVMTDEGWKTIEEAHRRQLRVAVSGVGGTPIRFFDDYWQGNTWDGGFNKSPSQMQPLSEQSHGPLSQHKETAHNSRLSALQSATKSISSNMVISSLCSAKRALRQSVKQGICAIWRAGYKIFVQFHERCSALDSGKSWYCRQVYAVGSDRQQWTLRARKFALGGSSYEYEQYKKMQWGAQEKIYSIQTELPASEVCRQNPSWVNKRRVDGYSDSQTMGNSIGQAEREVWDILNAGPLQRFTANGRLVHNCLILDHSATVMKLGFVTDIHHDTLKSGEKGASKSERERETPLPKECPVCTALKPAKARICPNCGHESLPMAEVRTVRGELVEIKQAKDGKIESFKKKYDDRAKFYGMLLWYANKHGYKTGWAYYKFKEIYKVGPPKGVVDPVEPSVEVLGIIRHLMIKQAHTKNGYKAKNNGRSPRTVASNTTPVGRI
jgi:superfamily II DNA or RNA helicase